MEELNKENRKIKINLISILKYLNIFLFFLICISIFMIFSNDTDGLEALPEVMPFIMIVYVAGFFLIISLVAVLILKIIKKRTNN